MMPVLSGVVRRSTPHATYRAAQPLLRSDVPGKRAVNFASCRLVSVSVGLGASSFVRHDVRSAPYMSQERLATVE